MKDLTESEVQESWRIMVLCIPKVPLQGFSSVPAESVLALYCNIEDKREYGNGKIGMEGFREKKEKKVIKIKRPNPKFSFGYLSLISL